MKKMKLLSSTLFVFLVLAAVAVKANAQQAQTLEQDQEMEMECDVEVGAYGQGSSRCRVLGEQHQRAEQTQAEVDQHVVYVDDQRVVIREHVPVDTALDFKTMAVAMTSLLGSAAATVVKLRSRV